MRDHINTKTGLWSLMDEAYDPGYDVHKKAKKLKPERTIEIAALQVSMAEELNQEESGFNFTYKASRHEQQWISQALKNFYLDSLISDVLSMVRGGKEANVYCCRSHPNVGMGLLAAKIYRPRLLRNLKNDAVYKEGRVRLGDDGKAMRDGRSARAVSKKTRIGKEMSITSWIEHEFLTLQTLYEAGANVPRPVAQNGNAILMEYIGEQGFPAPTLSMVKLDPYEARSLFEQLIGDVRMMLSKNRVHADLSAYNVLYWEGRGVIIDFPQVVDPLFNPRGYFMLARDIERLCQYFNHYGLNMDARKISRELWREYLNSEPE